MKKILTAITILVSLAGISHADIVYTTSGGSLGVIPVSGADAVGVPEIQYVRAAADPLIGSYSIGKDHYVMVVERASNNVSGDTALIFRSSNLTQPEKSVVLGGVYGTKTFGASYNGRSLFFASEENTSIVEIQTSDMTTKNAYTYVNTSEDADYDPELIDMSVGIYNIHSLFRATPEKIELFAFDGQLRDEIEDSRRGVVRNDATMLAELNAQRFAIGGKEGISIVNASVISTLTSTDYPVEAICRDNGNGLYYVEHSETGDVRLWHFSTDSDAAKLIDSLKSDSECKLVRDSTYNVLAFMANGSIYLYDMSKDLFIASFDSTALGGVPINMAESAAEADDGSSSGSNCNVSCMGLVLIGVLGAALRRKR